MIEKYWRYTCNSPSGPLRGRIGAEDKAEAETRLAAMGIRPTTLEYIDPSKPEEAAQIPRKGKEIPLGSLPSSPPPIAFHPKDIVSSVPVPEIPNQAKDMGRISEMAKNIAEPLPARKEKLIYGFPEEVLGVIERLYELNGKTKFIELRQDQKGRLVLAIVIEHDKEKTNEKGKPDDGGGAGAGNPLGGLQRPGQASNEGGK